MVDKKKNKFPARISCRAAAALIFQTDCVLDGTFMK